MELEAEETVRNPGETSALASQAVRSPSDSLLQLDLAQKALDIAGVILVAMDPTGNVVFMNRKGHEILDYADGELIGKCWPTTCLLENERQKVHGALAQLRDADGKTIGCFENHVVTRTGRRRLIAWCNVALLDSAGQCVGTLSSGEDITERRAAEDAIRHEKAFSDAIIDSLPGPFYVLNEHGRYVRWNKVQEELIGLPPDQIPNVPALCTIHKDDRHLLTQKTAQVFREGHGVVEARQRDTDRIFCFTGKRMEIAGDRFMVGTGIDITERKNAEETLRESEERFRGVVETSPDAIAVVDFHGRFLLVNRQAAKLNGHENKDSFAKHVHFIHEVMSPEDRTHAVQEARKAIVSGESRTFEARFVRRDGTVWPGEVCCSTLRDSDGKPVAVITVTRDLTDRKLAEERQTRSLQRLEGVNRLQENLLLPEPLTKKFRRITQAAVELLNLDSCRIWIVQPADQCERGCPHAVSSDSQQACPDREKCLHLSTSAGSIEDTGGRQDRIPIGCCQIGRIASGEQRKFLIKDIAAHPQVAGRSWLIEHGLVAVAGHKLHDSNGTPIGVLAVFAKHAITEEDDAFLSNLAEITSRVILDSQAREELQETRRQAIAASMAKSEFLANMSHEIRTPMTAILGFTDLLMNQRLSDREQHDFLETIARNGRSLLVLINDILDLSKIEAEKMTIESVAYPLRQIVNDVLDVVQGRANEKRLSLDVSYEGVVPEIVHTDPTRLRQILVNLVGNAIKFTERGGVHIAVRQNATDGDAVVLEFAVVDTGIGIEKEKLLGLFQPFAQADASTTRRFGGTGLGLAISKRLANMLGGDVRVVSEYGRGSTFILTIDASPAGSESPAPTPVAASSTAVPENHRAESRAAVTGRILVAEDSADLQRLLCHWLQKMKLDIDIAGDGQAACESAVRSKIEGRPYDLILMDMQMPEMDGLQATRWLRTHGWTGPIIAVTAHAMAEHRDGCIAAGCDDYLAKPIQVAELRAMVSRCLQRGVPSPGSPNAPLVAAPLSNAATQDWVPERTL